MIDEAFGGADHLVYAAGIGSGKGGFPFWNLDAERLAALLDVYLIGLSIQPMLLYPALWSGGAAHGS